MAEAKATRAVSLVGKSIEVYFATGDEWRRCVVEKYIPGGGGGTLWTSGKLKLVFSEGATRNMNADMRTLKFRFPLVPLAGNRKLSVGDGTETGMRVGTAGAAGAVGAAGAAGAATPWPEACSSLLTAPPPSADAREPERPRCPHCASPLRPAVVMFGDTDEILLGRQARAAEGYHLVPCFNRE